MSLPIGNEAPQVSIDVLYSAADAPAPNVVDPRVCGSIMQCLNSHSRELPVERAPAKG